MEGHTLVRPSWAPSSVTCSGLPCQGLPRESHATGAGVPSRLRGNVPYGQATGPPAVQLCLLRCPLSVHLWEDTQQLPLAGQAAVFQVWGPRVHHLQTAQSPGLYYVTCGERLAPALLSSRLSLSTCRLWDPPTVCVHPSFQCLPSTGKLGG